ncbi:MAG: MarR family transcriptional regulator [Polyangiaceae bacterium]
MPTRAPRRLRKRHERGELRAIVDESIGLFHRLRWVAEQIYGEGGRSTARRGVLRGLARYGAQTVPELARARSLRRQSVQEVVDSLVADGLARRLDNPEHARSKRVQITAKGTQLVERMDRVDERVLATIEPGLSRTDLAVTARTIRIIRERFEASLRWRSALDQS